MELKPDCKELQYCGRIDFTNRQKPVFVYPCTSVKMHFRGSRLFVMMENHHAYWKNDMGYILDGVQGRLHLAQQGMCRLEIPVTQQGEHTLLLFKRQDSCHTVTFYGFEILTDEGEQPEVLPLPAPSQRRIEVYGDSVSAGEVSEAVDFVGKPDPEHEGEYSNSWYSYAWMTARKLNARIHDIAQGGIALLPDTGWFLPPHCYGMEQIYDKISYHPQLGPVHKWDFSAYRPQVVIVAIGQNDSHPVDYMAEEPGGRRAMYWIRHYERFIRKLRELYPLALIVLTTTLLQHDRHWDAAVEEACRRIGDDRIKHFLYRRNGRGTPGHLRIPEAEEMAEELSSYLRSFGEDLWREESSDSRQRLENDRKGEKHADN